MEFETGFMTKDYAEAKLALNQEQFAVQSYKYCGNVCNLFSNISTGIISTQESKCLGNKSA